MEVAFVPCLATVTTTEILRSQLEARGDAYAAEESYGCELQAEHEGPHYAMGQSLEPEWTADGDDDVWIRWSRDHDATLETKPMCTATHDDGEYCGGDGICMLYGGHPGPHTDECESRWLFSSTESDGR